MAVTELLRLALAVVLPWMFGAFWHWALLGGIARRPGGLPLVLGGGYLLGTLALTLVMRGFDAAGWTQTFGGLAAVVVALTLPGFAVARRRSMGAVDDPQGRMALSAAEKSLFLLLLALVLVHFGMFAFEVVLRPLYPWDAWANWAPKARVWFEYKTLVEFVSPQEWLATGDPALYTVDAPHYPPAVPLMQLWFALASGRWSDTFINLPWLFCGLSLALALYGQCRTAGAGPLASLVAVYLLVSLPMFGTHVALGGYGDLWVAATFGVAAMSALQWLRGREVGFAYASLLFAFACTLVKVEGVVWSGVLLFVVLGSLIPRKLFFILAGLSILGFTAVILLGGFETRLPGLGELVIMPERLVIPVLGEFSLGFHPVWGAFWEQYWLWGSWNLFWWAFLLLLLAAPFSRAMRANFSALLLSFAVLSVIAATFFFTENYLWAESVTTLNRATLHLLPTLVFVSVLLFQSLSRNSEEGASLLPSSMATR